MTTKLAYEDVLDKFNANSVQGKYGALYVMLLDTSGTPVNPGGGGGGGGGAVTIADGADVTQGAKADTPATDDTGSWTISAVLKRVSGLFNSVIGAKSAGTAAVSSMLVGGTYNTTRPFLTAGQQHGAQVDARGNICVRAMGTAFTPADGAANLAAAFSGENDGSGGSKPLSTAPFVFNGTTYDRQRGGVKGTWTIGAPLTNTNRSVAVGTTTTALAAANATRAGFMMQNISAAGDIWYAFGIPAVVGGLGCFKLIPGATFFMEDNVVDTAAINVIASAAATNLTALEY